MEALPVLVLDVDDRVRINLVDDDFLARAGGRLGRGGDAVVANCRLALGWGTTVKRNDARVTMSRDARANDDSVDVTNGSFAAHSSCSRASSCSNACTAAGTAATRS